MPTRPASRSGRILLIPALMALLSAPLAAQAQPGAAAAVPHVDRNFGFQINLPATWDYDRTAFFGPGGSLGLLRGAARGGHQSLQILAFRNVKTATIKEWLDFFAAKLGAVSDVTGVLVKYQDESTAAGARPYGYTLVRGRAGGDRIETLYYSTRLDESTIWVLALARVLPPDADPAPPNANSTIDIPPDFQAMVDSLKIDFDPKAAAEMREAVDRGRAWLARFQLQEAVRKLRIDENTRYYEIVVSGKPIGYLTRRFAREWRSIDETDSASSRNKKEGIRVAETTWRFADDGSANFGVIDLFSSVDGATDLIEQTETRIPPADAKDQKPITARDQCVREGDVLVSSMRSTQETGWPETRQPIRLEPSYLGLAWARLLPSLVGRDEQPWLGFTIYDSETHAVQSHAIRSLGESAGSQPADRTCRYETRDGLVGVSARLVTDARGHLQRAEAGELIIRLSSEDQIESQFGAKRDAAKKRIPVAK